MELIFPSRLILNKARNELNTGYMPNQNYLEFAKIQTEREN